MKTPKKITSGIVAAAFGGLLLGAAAGCKPADDTTKNGEQPAAEGTENSCSGEADKAPEGEGAAKKG